jgi:HSP20 family molecular chaperone IbpA
MTLITHKQDGTSLISQLIEVAGEYTDFLPINSSYPNYTVYKNSNTCIRVELELAGLSKEQVSVYTEFGYLTVEGNIEEKNWITLSRRFKWVRALPENWEIEKVSFENAMLKIYLEYQVPENQKRRDVEF